MAREVPPACSAPWVRASDGHDVVHLAAGRQLEDDFGISPTPAYAIETTYKLRLWAVLNNLIAVVVALTLWLLATDHGRKYERRNAWRDDRRRLSCG
jgi:hypothetical protein